MTDLELTVAAFVKMAKGEAVSVADAGRLFDVFINRPPQIDSQNQAQVQQLMAQAREGLQKVYFGNQ